MKMLIGGMEVDASNGAVTPNINPATGAVINTVPCATPEDLERTIVNAVEGQKEWAAIPFHKRMEILERFVILAQANEEKIARTMAEEGGKPLAQALGEVGRVKDAFRLYIAEARTMYGKTLPLNSEPRALGDVCFTVFEPLGVIAAICAFNFPGVLFSHKAAAALCTGNSVIIKPASDTPGATMMMTKLLLEAGVPGNAVQCITGSGSVAGDALVADPRVAGVTLTGSTRVGIRIAELCATQLKPYSLELGGNDPFVIFDDVDVDEAVAQALGGRIANAGQICCSSKRFIVQNSMKDAFAKKLAEKLDAMKLGDPLDPETQVGPIINEKSAIHIISQIKHAVEQGAKILCGGTREGCFVRPTVLVDVPKDSDVATNEEIFGPVFPVIGFDTIEEAIAIANNSQYGLSSGILTKDMKKAMKFALEVDAGGCVVGGNGNYRLTQQPFNGHKMSGFGTEGTMYTLHEMVKIKTITLKNMF
ncbi:MAG: aldehyde dehydrogenase [Oscillospiraceae bacterium]|nr:aldehyde dehydrogenase [Oscillospiraceae bacterium]